MRQDRGLRNNLKQTIDAVESGQYRPSATVALHLVRGLGCQVEDLCPMGSQRQALGGLNPSQAGETMASVNPP